MSALEIPTARVFLPLLDRARDLVAYGGRASGKSHFFAGLMVERALCEPGFRGVCVREVQKDLKDSAKLLIEDKIAALGVSKAFDIQRDVILTPGGGQIIFRGMNDYNADSIKSLEGFDVAWCEEAQTITKTSITLLRPTLRKEGSELWWSFNPRREKDPVNQLFRGPEPQPNAIVVKANWSDNPWFPEVLEAERANDQRLRPDMYDHIWEGGYVRITDGAYFAASLTQARQEKRIGKVPRDPLMAVRAFWDIGGTGARADACAIWVAQFIGREIRVLDYYEAQGQPLATHVEWLRSSGYGNAVCVLPHDGAQSDKVFDASYEGALRAAGFEVTVVPNQGKGAAMQRIEAVRRLFPAIWIDERCEAGVEALGAYHERKDDARGIGLGPNHNWASHAADAFGLMCVAYEAPRERSASGPLKARSGIY